MTMLPAWTDVETPPPVTVVGDVHLTTEEPEVARRFLAFLGELEPLGGTVVLLGDVFDWWAGRPQGERPLERAVFERLRALPKAGVRLAFVRGNRDFAFDGAPDLDVVLWADTVRTTWGERTVLLTHGDLLCTADEGYLRMRRMLRSGWARGAMRVTPFAVKEYVARGLRAVSERSGRHSPGAMLGIDYGEALRWMEAAGAEVLVAGHVHTGLHHRLAGAEPREVWVLKDWDRAANAIRFDGRRIAYVTPR